MNTKLITTLLLAAAFALPALSEEPKAQAGAAPAAAEAPAESAQATTPQPETETETETEAAPAAEEEPKPEAAAEAKEGKEKKPAKAAKAKKGGKAIPYPLDTCIVTDNELGSMGDPLTKIHEGQEIKFCCKPCVKAFDKDPAQYLKKLEELS